MFFFIFKNVLYLYVKKSICSINMDFYVPVCKLYCPNYIFVSMVLEDKMGNARWDPVFTITCNSTVNIVTINVY